MPTILLGSAFGVCELAVHALREPIPGADVPAAVGFAVLAYATLAGLCVPLAHLTARWWPEQRGRPFDLAFAASVLLTLGLAGRLIDHSRAVPLAVVAIVCATFAYVVFRCALAVLQRFSRLGSSLLLGLPAAASALFVAITAAGAPVAPKVAPPESPSVLLITIDTLRADFLGAYGRKQARTPILDALADRGTRFDAAISHSIITGPSHLSILSGLLPEHHGVTENSLRAPKTVATIAERLSDRGFTTGAIVSGGPVTEEALGILSRFDDYDDDFRSFRLLPEVSYRTTLGAPLQSLLEAAGQDFERHRRSANEVTERALAWLDGRAGRPFFLWVHYYDPHLPYEPPDEYLSEEARAYSGPATGNWYFAPPERRQQIIQDAAAMAQMARLYDAEIAHADAQIGRLLERAAAVADDRLWVIATADHGESFGEHGIYFWRDLYEPTLRVPLIIAGPDGPPQVPVVEDVVGLIDLAPTILELTGVGGGGLDGASVLGLMRGESGAGRLAQALVTPSRPDPWDRDHHAVRTRTHKAIWREAGWAARQDNRWLPEVRERYDLAADPRERENVIALEPERFEILSKLARTRMERAPAPQLTQRELKMLRELGYAR